LSRGTADLARQVAEFGRRLAAVEGRVVSANSAGADRIQAIVGEINELGVLVKELAVSVAGHEDMLSSGVPPAAAPVPKPEDAPPKEPSAAAAAVEEKSVAVVAAAPVKIVEGPAPPRSQAQILTAVKNAMEENRIDIYLQPMVTLPQRKVRFYEAVTRLRDDKDQILAADDFIAIAEAGGLIGKIDHMVMLRCIQVLRRLMVRNKDVGVFCNVSAATLGNPANFAQCLDFLEANRALAPSFVLEFKQAAFRHLGPTEIENLAALSQRGYRFSIDHVTDLRIEPRDLADRGVRFIKVPAALLLDPKQSSTSDIHPSDLSDLLGRFGIDLIAEKIEGERAVVDLLDYDVRFGQGFLFAPPRPLRPEGASATGGATANKESGAPNGSSNTVPIASPAAEPPMRATGNAALVRRAAGPG
jgi:cyclic-di-GMP phosphodiesterase TipF (flagellum assembly factor)